MDALAALGLASNILSFVDFTWKLLAGANEIYASGAGIADDARFLDTITRDVRYYDERIVAVPNATPELQSLARQCDEIAQDLLESLDKLRIKGHKTRWNSFLVALRGVRSKKKVEQLTDKIAKIQSRMTAHMQELLLHNVSDLSRAIKELQLTHVNLGIATKDEVPSLKQEIQDALEKLVDDNSTARMKEYFQQRQAQELSPGLIAEVSAQMQRLAHAMGNLELRGTEAGSNHKLLKKIYFKSISTRERKIEKAHSSTFQWLVNSDQQPKQCLDFTTWLRRGNGVFWIHGKPGSGKSTFMKFVCNQKVVRDYIQDWANSDQLVTASFYFWYAGSRLQNSLEGLLRTLLFEMLRHVPGVIPSITSDSKLILPLSYDEDWDLDTLFKMYDIVLRGQKGVKFCFFIDGLDEFKDEDHRSLRDLIAALRRLETSDNMKLCVGSRSWVEFADIYGHVPCKSLKLEDLTRNDIQNYVKDRFNSHEQFSRLQETDPNYEGLVSEVVDRAQGVFLWVRLVVQMLLEGFTFHDSVNTLRQRLTSFPEDLEEFFDHMLKSIPSAYRGQAAQTFKVATEVDQPRLLIFYYFLDEELQKDPLTLNSSYTPLDPLEVSAKCEKMRRQLNARSRGLLEITTDDNDGERSASTQGSDSCYFDSKVDFLHRTVRDFLVSPRKTLDFFNSNVGNNTDLSIAAAKAAFDQVKFAEFSGPTQFSRLVDIFFSHTRHAAGVSESTTKLDDVLEAAEELCIEIHHRNDWAQSVYFLGLAAQSGHTSFFERKFSTGHPLVAMEPHQPYLASSTSNQLLRSKHPLSSSTNASGHLLGWIRKRPSVTRVSRPLLDYALTPLRTSSVPYLDTVELLLSQGAPPNERFQNTTVWKEFLLRLDPSHEEAIRNDYFPITKALLRNGAHLNHKMPERGGGDSSPGSREARFPWIRYPNADPNVQTYARDYIEDYFSPDQVKELVLPTFPEILGYNYKRQKSRWRNLNARRRYLDQYQDFSTQLAQMGNMAAIFGHAGHAGHAEHAEHKEVQVTARQLIRQHEQKLLRNNLKG